jgi:anti-sigma B factor antagonist
MGDGRFLVDLVSGVPVVAAPEEIDITNAPDLRSALLEAAADGRETLVADMTRTRFCDSSGLHTLLTAHKRAQDEGGELRLVIPDAAVLRVFALTGIDRMIPNFASLKEALAHTSAGGSNGRPRSDGRPERSAVKTTGTAARHGTSGPAEKRADRHATRLPLPSPGNCAGTTGPPQSSKLPDERPRGGTRRPRTQRLTDHRGAS